MRERQTVRLALISIALAIATGLAGCGFKPLYGSAGGTVETLRRIHIDQIADRSGQILRNELLLRLPARRPGETAAYVLKVELREEKRRLGLEPEDVATLTNLTVFARFVLEDAEEGKPVFAGQLSSTNSYNILDSEFGTLKAESNARERALRQISDALTTRLAAYMSRRS